MASSVPASASCSRPSIPPQSWPWRPDPQSLGSPLEQSATAVQIALERSLGKQRVEMALENQAVESSDRAGYRIPVQITENGHVDLARVRGWFSSSKVGVAVSLKSIRRGRDRHRLWLRPRAALRSGPT